MDSCGLYIHIPFCQRKCSYCDFPSYCNIENQIEPYIKALKEEIHMVAQKYSNIKIKTIFIGGGTPTYIHSKYIVDILNMSKKNFSIHENAEISMEANPGTFHLEDVTSYYGAGINRLSIGLQAWQNNLLKKLGRIHTREEFLQAFHNAKEVGIQNINIDLMFGLPGQTLENWQETLGNISTLNPTHLSCYSLKIEEGTPLYNLNKNGNLKIDEDLEREMYYYTKEFLKSKGYKHYEISNFAKPGFECRHNLVYWEIDPYIGVGSSAHSFINNSRYSNTSSVEEYLQKIQDKKLPVMDQCHVSQKELMEEYIFLGLRKIEGFSREDFKRNFGKNIEEIYGDVLDELVNVELIKINDRIALTDKGLDYGNVVFQSFL